MIKTTDQRNLLFVSGFSVLIILEISLNLYFNRMLSQGVCATALLGVSVLSGLSILLFYYNKTVTPAPVHPSAKKAGYLNLLLLLAGTGLLVNLLYRLYLSIPIDAKTSDIIPLVKILIDRFFSGQPVYTPIEEFGYTMLPNYLPMHWLPYCAAYLMKFDYRWIALLINVLAGCWIVKRSSKYAGPAMGLFIPLLIIANWLIILYNNDGIFSNTIEIMVAGYYMLFIVGLNNRSAILKGIFIAICLMSRFSLVLWLPLWLFVEWISSDRKKLIVSLGAIAGFILLVYVIPFLSKDWTTFMKGYDYYTTSAVGEWGHLDGEGKPYALYSGSGFAYLFYENQHMDLLGKIKALQRTHMVFCLGSAFVMGLWYWFKRNKINARIFLMGSFKIYISIFLALIQVPYNYLMITGTFVSIAILAELMRYRAYKEI